MATGHWNPGYGNIVSSLGRLRRVKSAHPLAVGGQELWDYTHVPLDNRTFDDIYQKARSAWLKPERSATSYQDHFVDKNEDVDEYQRSRPTSPSRKNKPHPPQVFLTCRLHSVPGYHNADTTVGKEAYKVDASRSPEEQYMRDTLKSKYVGRPSSKAVRQYRHYEGPLQMALGDDPANRRMTEDNFRRATYSRSMLIDADENPLGGEWARRRSPMEGDYEDWDVEDAILQSQKPRPVASITRYMREAGVEETEKFNDMYNSKLAPFARPPSMMGMRLEEPYVPKPPKSIFRPTTKRGDFLLHPDWPPTIVHHRLNGLSAVPKRPQGQIKY